MAMTKDANTALRRKRRLVLIAPALAAMLLCATAAAQNQFGMSANILNNEV